MKIGNDGKARVGAQQAVAFADENWLTLRSEQPFCRDAMAHLRRFQQDHSLPVSLRHATIIIDRLTNP